jgi:hypothetical protein
MANPMFDKVFFLATARSTDKVLVATVTYNNKNIDLSAVKQMLGSLQAMESSKLYAFSMGNYAWNLMETGGVIYIVATDAEYPSRIASVCLQDCARLFVARVQESWKTAKEGGLSDTCKKLLVNLCEKYDNLAEIDKVTSTLGKVDVLKMKMQDNIRQALENSVTLEKIESDAADLQASAGIFRQQAKSLKSKMWWKNLKMKLLIAGVVLTILGVVAILIASQVGAFDDDNKK